MSWDVTFFTCKKCDFQQGDLSTWGSKKYQLEDGTLLPMEWRLGWCSDCNGIVGVEDLESLAKVNGALQLLANRRSGARCLDCGSPNIFNRLITAKDVSEIKNRKIETGFIHPNCGGSILMEQEGVRFAVKASLARYTQEGELIDKEYVD
jgi:hypothetical protein